ncbi:hypothetical protein POM88_026834 [Heracleum sosnowskyi]|uniref:Endonuclease/exonuclease/phosphatase domain-containing protein n=1 Tax=Heracleum sosnowskyi TaxID=360622 RepID=A0AAD8I7I0_9APIA|nr:hypothetical protein POM88_026834 [Heracleum sosnowskyi]
MLCKVKIKGPGRPKKRENSKNPFEIGRCKFWPIPRKGLVHESNKGIIQKGVGVGKQPLRTSEAELILESTMDIGLILKEDKEKTLETIKEQLAKGHSGGILNVWKKGEFDLINTELRSNWVGVSLQFRNGGSTLDIFNVYAPHGSQEKLVLWNEFRRIYALLDSLPTIFIGDFNEVRFQRERSNCNTRPRETREFNNWIEDSNLVKIPLESANFTWIADWTLKVLPRKNSNHRGILLRARHQNWGPKPFRVFNVWLRNPSLNKEIEDYFSESASLPNLHLQQKLRNVKHVIKTWNLSMNGNIFHRISELENKVAKLEEDNGPRNELAI